MRRRIYIAGGALLALVAAFVAGRYSAPRKVETKTEWRERVVTQIEWRDKIVEKRTEGPVREVERIVEKPGAERVVTRWIERGPVTTDTATNTTGTASATTDQSSATRTVSEGERPGWSAGFAAAWDSGRPSFTPDRLGLELDRRLFGTVWLGVRASSTTDFAEPSFGLALRMEF